MAEGTDQLTRRGRSHDQVRLGKPRQPIAPPNSSAVRPQPCARLEPTSGDQKNYTWQLRKLGSCLGTHSPPFLLLDHTCPWSSAPQVWSGDQWDLVRSCSSHSPAIYLLRQRQRGFQDDFDYISFGFFPFLTFQFYNGDGRFRGTAGKRPGRAE